jgi:hypothetical protein
MSLVLPLAAAAALLFMGGGKSPAKPKARAPAKARVIPQGMAAQMTAPKSAPKSAPAKRPGFSQAGPQRRAPAPKVTQSATLTAPLTSAPSQGGSPSMAAPLSADIPSDVSPVAQRSAPTPRSHPGYSPTVARRSASSIANHLRRAGKAKYDRRLLRQWQTQAGLTADGLYGPATRGALVYYGIKDPPAPFAGSGIVPFRPPV